jgi:hypothetical protein
MAKKSDSKLNVEVLSDPGIYEAIRYLEPDQILGKHQKDDTVFAICVTVVILLLGCIGFVWLWWK